MTTFDKRILVAAVALAAAGAVSAQTTMPPASQGAPQPQMQKGFTGELRSGPWSNEGFVRLDTNKDGMLSREEAQADPIVRDAWNKLDPRSAGRISLKDFDAYGATQPASNQAPNLNSAGPVPSTSPKQ